jgi:hypothetical protein
MLFEKVIGFLLMAGLRIFICRALGCVSQAQMVVRCGSVHVATQPSATQKHRLKANSLHMIGFLEEIAFLHS